MQCSYNRSNMVLSLFSSLIPLVSLVLLYSCPLVPLVPPVLLFIGTESSSRVRANKQVLQAIRK